MADLGKLTCFADQRNVGTGPCQYIPGIPLGSILIRKGQVLTKAEVLSLRVTLEALFTNDNKAFRAYPIGLYEGVENTGSERQQQTSNSTGRTRTTRRSRLAKRYTLWGSKNYYTGIFSFDGMHGSFDELIFDDKYQLRGVSKLDAAGKPGMGGFALGDLYVGDYMDPNGTDGAMFTIDVDYADSRQMNTREIFAKLDFNPITDLLVLSDVVLTDETPTGGAANVAIVGVTHGGGNDTTAVYGVTLAKPDAWIVTDNATGNAVVPTAVATVPGVGYSFTFSAGTGKTYTFRLKIPSALKALTPTVLGLEAVAPVVITIP